MIVREIGIAEARATRSATWALPTPILGQMGRAIELYEQRLAIAREIGDRRGEGIVLGNLGIAYAALGQTERAVSLLERALQIGQEIQDPRIVRFASARLEELRGSRESSATDSGGMREEAKSPEGRSGTT